MQWFRSTFLRSPKTFLLSLFIFLLPWQTHILLSDGVLLGGDIASPFTMVKLYAVELLLVATALAAVAVKKDRPTIDAAYRLPIALACTVFVFAALSSVWSVSPLLSYGMLLHLGAALLFFVLILDSNLDLKPILLAFGAGLIGPAFLGLWQHVFDASPSSTIFGLAARDADTLGDAVTVAKNGVRELRAYGSFPHPNVFGGYLAVGMMAIVAGVKGENGKVKSWLLAILLVLTIALVLTGSRTAIAGTLLAIVLVGLIRRLRNTRYAAHAAIFFAAAAVAVMLAGTFFAPGIVASVRGGGATEERAIAERVEQYGDYSAVMLGNVPLGSGLGAYVIAAYDAKTCASWDCQPIHNVPLLVVGEIGLVGALMVFAFAWSVDRINFARFTNQNALVAFGMGTVVLVALFFDHYAWSSWPGLALIAFVMACTLRMGETLPKL